MTQEDIRLFLESVDNGFTYSKVQPQDGACLTYRNDEIRGCGVMSALINKNGVESYLQSDTGIYDLMNQSAQKEFNMTPSFLHGFIDGFDGSAIERMIEENSTEYDEGYLYGCEKRKKWILREKQQ
jgi:hypothetical protein